MSIEYKNEKKENQNEKKHAITTKYIRKSYVHVHMKRVKRILNEKRVNALLHVI